MAILVRRETGVLVQGITGTQARQHVEAMREYGTRIVAGVSPRRAASDVHGIRVYASVADAVTENDVAVSLVMVPPSGVRPAVEEGIEAGLKTFVVITEGVPVYDMIRLHRRLRQAGARLIGPNSMGIISPGESKIGIMPSQLYGPGPVGIVSRTGSLTHEIASLLLSVGIGQSTCVDIGGDAVVGCDMVEICDLFFADPATRVVVLLGEIGGSAEEDLASALEKRAERKQVFAFLAGRHVPQGTTMGHSGAIVLGGMGSVESKTRALEKAAVAVARRPSELVGWVRKAVE